MDWSWALERARRSGGHLQKAGEGQLETDNYLGKHIHHAAEGNMVVGTWWSFHLSVEMCPQDKTCCQVWHPCCIFSQRIKALSGLLRGLYFSPLNQAPPDEG